MMTLMNALKTVPEENLSKVVVNDIPLINYDVLASEFISLTSVPVYRYQLVYSEDGDLERIEIETLWS